MKRLNRNLTVVALLVAAPLISTQAHAQSRWSIAYTTATNVGSYLGIIDGASSSTGAQVEAHSNTDFTGQDSHGNTQTMNFTGTTRDSAEYGRLRCYASGTVTNTYYNPANPEFYNSTTGVYNYAGSPSTMACLGFSGFDDVLHFGGSLQAGYKARYIFHVDGTNSGYRGAADLSVGIAGNADESFFAFDPGSYNENWVTQTYDINGSTPQSIHVQFSNQFVVDANDVPEGSTFSGTSDFSSTLTLAQIQVVDASGNVVTGGWTVDAASGTHYPTVPEPASFAALALGAGFLIKRRRS